MADHAINNECRTARQAIKDDVTKLNIAVFGNGNEAVSLVNRMNKLHEKKLVEESDLDDYVTKDELKINTSEIITAVTKAIDKRLTPRTQEENIKFKFAKLKSQIFIALSVGILANAPEIIQAVKDFLK